MKTKGFTLVEVMVAFAILAILSLGFFEVVRMASQMMMDGQDLEAEAQEREQLFYEQRREGAGTALAIPVEWKPCDAEGNLIKEGAPLVMPEYRAVRYVWDDEAQLYMYDIERGK